MAGLKKSVRYSGSLNRAGSTVDKLSEGVIGVIVMNIVCSYFVNVLVTAIVVVAEVSIVSNKDVTASREDSYFSDNDVDVDRIMVRRNRKSISYNVCHIILIKIHIQLFYGMCLFHFSFTL